MHMLTFMLQENLSELAFSVFQRYIHGVVLYQESEHGNSEIRTANTCFSTKSECIQMKDRCFTLQCQFSHCFLFLHVL